MIRSLILALALLFTVVPSGIVQGPTYSVCFPQKPCANS